MLLGHRLMKSAGSIGHKAGMAMNAIGHKYIPTALGVANNVLAVANTANKVKNLLTRLR